jgi:uncharacterized protein YuzE
MAEMTDFLTFEPVMPSPEHLAADRMTFNYDREADILLIHFDGPRPAIMLDVDDHLLLGINPESHEVVGLQIEAYLSVAVFKQPRLLDLAPAAGIPDDEISEIRSRMKPTAIAQATIRSLLDALHLQTA